MNIIEGYFEIQNKKIAIVASRFNTFVVDRLIEGAHDTLLRHGCKNSDIDLYKISGAFEFPGFLSFLLRKHQGKYSSIICLGAVIRGETPHFDYVASEATKGVAQLSMSEDIPLIYGILTTDTLEQAVNRAGAKTGNKGAQAALSALEMMSLYSKV